MVEYDPDMLQLLAAGRHVQYESAITQSLIEGDLLRDLRVIADEVGAERVVVLERPHPVDALAHAIRLRRVGELLVPVRVGDLQGKRVGELPVAVCREALISDLPGFLFG